jgi:glycosyltransferase involved in cell wall biosynthesis
LPVRRRVKFVYALSDAIVAASEAVRQVLLRSGIPTSKVLVIRYGIDLKAFPNSLEARQRVRQELGISEEQPLCILVGRLAASKGHTYYLQAAQQILKRFPNTGFLIVGDGELKASLQEESEQRGIAERVLFTGFRRDVPDLLYAADVSVVPSVWEEPFAYVLQESMAAARPVVASAVGGTPEIVEDGVSGFLVEPCRADLLAEAISQLLADPDLRRSMGEKGRQRIERDFTVERMARDYEELYRSLLSPRGSGERP